jgi:putative CocE/NonD family hydrolase
MRDGVQLAANIFLPEKPGKYPVIVVRTPYGRVLGQQSAIYFAQHGYVTVSENVRGRYDSSGEWVPLVHEPEDGYDTIEWAARQPWSNGKVATMGGSYEAIDQWLAASKAPPHLVAMISIMSGPNPYQISYTGGAYRLFLGLSWAMTECGRTSNNEILMVDWAKVMRHLPVIDAGKEAGCVPQFYRDGLDHPTLDSHWGNWDNVYSEHPLPVMNITGWYDLFQTGTIENYTKLMAHAPEPVRKAQRLIVGPWPHGVNVQKVGQVDFGPQSKIDLSGIELRWLNHYMMGEQNGEQSEPPVKVFAMGTNQWKNYQSWPPAGVKMADYYFHSGGKANSAAGDGSLSTAKPDREGPDQFTYNPANPVPTYGGSTCCFPQIVPWGPMDQQKIERRDDVLVYSTPPLKQDVELTGPVTVHLFASTNARDTDWTAKLVDVAPNGVAINLTDSILRARYRNSFVHPELLQPGRIYEFIIPIGNTSNVFRKEHRIRLEISSSNFPSFSRNTNTGGQPEKDTHFIEARQTIYHNAAHASYVVLPVLDAP